MGKGLRNLSDSFGSSQAETVTNSFSLQNDKQSKNYYFSVVMINV